MASFQELLKTLVERPTEFLPQMAAEATRAMVTKDVTDTQIGAYLTALKASRFEVEPAYIAQTAAALLEEASFLIAPSLNSQPVIDIVGTGGDGQSTFNVSTASAIIAAGAGCRVAKHGNRASSSACGSADVLEALGCALSKDLEQGSLMAHLQSKSFFCFLFAQQFHPALKRLSRPRKELGFRTIFNVLGPLINPVRPSRLIVGVYSPDLGETMAKTLLLQGVARAWVVHGLVGLDELSPEGETLVWDTADFNKEANCIPEKRLSPTKDFGLTEHSLETVRGGGPTENAEIMDQLLRGTLKPGHPILDFCLLNAGALLYVAGQAPTLLKAVALARQSIISGAAFKSLKDFQSLTTV